MFYLLLKVLCCYQHNVGIRDEQNISQICKNSVRCRTLYPLGLAGPWTWKNTKWFFIVTFSSEWVIHLPWAVLGWQSECVNPNQTCCHCVVDTSSENHSSQNPRNKTSPAMFVRVEIVEKRAEKSAKYGTVLTAEATHEFPVCLYGTWMLSRT